LELEDVNSNVAVRQYAYKITAIDTCGKETPVSLKHKTMHLMINEAINNHWNLVWMPYQGFNYGSYNIYRGTDSLNMSLLTTVSSNVHAYTDLNNPSGNIYYQIEVVSTDPCQSKVNGISRSKNFNTKYASGLGMNANVNNDLSMIIYPNPNKGNFVLEISSSKGEAQSYQLQVYSAMGALVHSEQIEVDHSISKQLHLATLSKGVYFIYLKNEQAVLNARFIIE
jgi:hypothetical protein